MSTRIEIRGLRVHGRHGVHEAERIEGQLFVVDAVLELERAEETDELATTVDYAALSGRLADITAGPPFALLESLAARLAQECLTDPRVRSASVTVHKPQVRLGVTVDDVAVRVQRSRA